MKSRSHKSAEASGNLNPGGSDGAEPPFSRPIIIEQVAEAGGDFAIEANADECAALAVCDGLLGIGRLEAHFHVAPKPGRRFNVSGRLTASITQTCVVSLDPFQSEVVEEIDVDFAPAEDPLKPDVMKRETAKPKLAKPKVENPMSHDRGLAGDDEEDPPDTIIDGKIDLGVIASEFLALALDPYPRKPGMEFQDVLIGETDQASPFAILRKLDKTS